MEGMEFNYEQYKGGFLIFVKENHNDEYSDAVKSFIEKKEGSWPVGIWSWRKKEHSGMGMK